MPWGVKSLMSQRHEFCKLALKTGNFSALCKRYEISRKTGYKWLHLFQTKGYEGLCDRSRRPHRIANQVILEVEAIVVHLHAHYPRWGPRKLHALMKAEASRYDCPSLSTVARIMKRHGLVREKEQTVDHYTVDQFERPNPNDLWQMDLKDLRLPDGKKLYSVGIIDDHSRYLLRLEIQSDCKDSSVLSVWINAAREFGLPNETLTDHGPQFRGDDKYSSFFRTHLWSCDVNHTQGRVRHPQTQGKIERLWRTLNHEVLSCHNYTDINSWQHCFDEWRHIYNHVRPHQALGDIVPANRYCPSKRPYSEPDRRDRVGNIDSIYRSVSVKGQINLSGKCLEVGRGFRGSVIELRPLGTGCWHAYYRKRFIKELLVTVS